MGSLSNLYISSSFQSLLHFGSDNTASVTLTEIQDGFGNGLGVYLNNSGSASFEGDVIVAGDLEISGAIDIEGAIIIRDNVYVTGSIFSSADISSSRVLSGEITASNVNITGTLTANKVVTLIESSSIIYSSGSNILGDETSDIQTLIGSVIISGSGALTGSMGISGNLNVGGAGTFGGTGSFIGDLTATGNISSSTLSGVGNVTTYSASVQSFINNVSSSLNTSASLALVTASFNLTTRDLTLTKGNNTSFNLNIPGTLAPSGTVSSSAQINIYDTDGFANFNDSIQFDINQKLFTSSFNAYTSSVSTSISALNTFTASLTGSFATLLSNNFSGSQTITGSVYGNVVDLSITSLTASMDCRRGNFFNLTLSSSANIFLNPTNISPGQTISLKVTQPATTGSLFSPANIKYPSGSYYNATAFSGAVDILTFVSYDSTDLYATAVKRLQ